MEYLNLKNHPQNYEPQSVVTECCTPNENFLSVGIVWNNVSTQVLSAIHPLLLLACKIISLTEPAADCCCL